MSEHKGITDTQRLRWLLRSEGFRIGHKWPAEGGGTFVRLGYSMLSATGMGVGASDEDAIIAAIDDGIRRDAEARGWNPITGQWGSAR